MFNTFLKFFINNARMNYLLFVLLFAIGIVSYLKTPKEIFPVFDLDMISVSGGYSGASVEILDKMVVRDIEDNIKSINGITDISTIINPARFSIVLELEKGVNRFNIANQVKDVVALAKQDLPSDMNDPTVRVIDLHKSLVEVSLKSNEVSFDDLKTKAKDLRSKLLSLKNISEVTIYGDSDKFYEIILDEQKIEAYGLNTTDIYNSIGGISFIHPVGKIEGEKKHLFLSTNNGAKSISEFSQTLIRSNNQTIYLRDIAKIKKRYEDSSTLFSVDGKKAINLLIKQNKNGNALTLTKKIENLLEKVSSKNSNIDYVIRNDQSAKIKDRLNIVVSNILVGVIAITLIVALLINTRMAFIIMIGIPTSFLLGAIYLYIFGYTINMISLVGVLIALGIIVDDAMVVSENIQQKVEEGLNPKEAAIQGASEMAKPVFISSITTLFAFLPALMISGTMGEVIKLIPIAISALIVASLIESFIFLPIHAAHTLKKDAKTLSWKKINTGYSTIIHLCMRFKKTFLLLFVILVPILTINVIKNSKFQMFPTFDATTLNITMKADVNTSLEKSFDIIKSIEKDILKNKDKFYIDNIGSVAGFRKDSGSNSENYPYVMYMTIELMKLKEQNFVDKYITPYLSFYYDSSNRTRELSSQEISKILKEYLKNKNYKERFNLIDLAVVEKKVGPIKADVKVGLISSDYEKISNSIKKIENKLNQIKGIKSVANSTNFGIEELKIKINQYGLSLGVDEQYIGSYLSNIYSSKKKTTAFDDKEMLDIRITSKNKDSIDNFDKLQIPLKDGTIIALKDICEFKIIKSYEKVIKENGEANFYVFANVDTKIITSIEVMNIIKPILKDIKKSGVKIVLKGEAQKNKELKNDMLLATSLAMVLIMLSMLYLFNSFRETFIVMSVIPFSLLGVLVGHQIMDVNLGMTTMIGALGLAGVVINDGIIMMTYLKKAKNLEEVYIQGSKRFRPIILTSVTTLIGVSTMIFFPTGQAVIFQPLAIALGFGLLWGTVINLIYLPVLYGFAYKLK
jgi:hydrophobic/amphiphilic exporter-1 (mainly G- bacteria), HAE1 family